MDRKAILCREARGGAFRLVMGLGGLSVAALAATGALAEEYKIGDVDLTVSGAATAGTQVRTTPRDPRLIFAPNGRKMGIPATATSGANQDDGNLNYAPGSPVSSVAKALATVDARYQNYGVLVTGKVWGDFTQLYGDVPWGNYANGYAAFTPLGQAGFGSRQQFAGFAVQQAYAYTRQTIDGTTVDARIGEINVPWGLQTAIPGGLAFAVNAFDYAAIVRPGAQAQEVLIPTPGVFTRWGFLEGKATLDAFYLFQGPQSQVPGCGTFFSGADWLPPGCNNVFFNPSFPDPTSFATDFALNRMGAPVVHDANFGVGGSYQADPLLTKFGLYYAHVDQPTPVGTTVKTLRTGNVLFRFSFPPILEISIPAIRSPISAQLIRSRSISRRRSIAPRFTANIPSARTSLSISTPRISSSPWSGLNSRLRCAASTMRRRSAASCRALSASRWAI